MASSNPAPGFANHPNHTVEIAAANGPINISIDDEVIAATNHALVLKQNGYGDAFYIPKSALGESMLQTSDHSTHCPFKGDASYYHLVHKGKVHENAVWSYKTPFDEAMKIKEHIAIYPNVAKVGPA